MRPRLHNFIFNLLALLTFLRLSCSRSYSHNTLRYIYLYYVFMFFNCTQFSMAFHSFSAFSFLRWKDKKKLRFNLHKNKHFSFTLLEEMTIFYIRSLLAVDLYIFGRRLKLAFNPNMVRTNHKIRQTNTKIAILFWHQLFFRRNFLLFFFSSFSFLLFFTFNHMHFFFNFKEWEHTLAVLYHSLLLFSTIHRIVCNLSIFRGSKEAQIEFSYFNSFFFGSLFEVVFCGFFICIELQKCRTMIFWCSGLISSAHESERWLKNIFSPFKVHDERQARSHTFPIAFSTAF